MDAASPWFGVNDEYQGYIGSVIDISERKQAEVEVIAADGAKQALATLTQWLPNILISDIGMPEMNGYMLLQQVRTLAPQQGGQIPAIALTAYAGDYNKQQASSAGFQGHIAKPIEPINLLKAIKDLIITPNS